MLKHATDFKDLKTVVDNGNIVFVGTEEMIANKYGELKEGEKINMESYPHLLTGTDFQKSVITALKQIPAGETRTYKEVAEMIGNPKAVRAAASAISSNPLPIIYPCHRVVPSSGGTGKYIFGVEMKQELLDTERSVS